MDDKTDNELIEAFWIWAGGKMHMRADIHLYESDWNMIMNVVEKIEILGYRVDVYKHGCEINTEEIIRFEVLSKIEACYKAIVEFIRWFNSQSPDTIK